MKKSILKIYKLGDGTRVYRLVARTKRLLARAWYVKALKSTPYSKLAGMRKKVVSICVRYSEVLCYLWLTDAPVIGV